LGGDFNLVLDVQKDKKGGNPVTYKNSLKEVQNIANLLDLIDVWRVFLTQMPKDSLGGERIRKYTVA